MKRILMAMTAGLVASVPAGAADYRLVVGSTAIIRTADGAVIPADTANADFQLYQVWIKAGNTPDPALAPPPVVPFAVNAIQAKLALSRAGLLNAAQTWVSSQNAETQLIWSSAPTFNRNSALINSAATALGLTSSQVDQLFITAAAINP